MKESNCVDLWNNCLRIIRENVPEAAYNTWFVPIAPLGYDLQNKILTLEVPSQFFYEFIEEKFIDLLSDAIYREFGKGTRLMYKVLMDSDSKESVEQESSNRSSAITPKAVLNGNKSPNILKAPLPQDLDPRLNPKYNFDNFIEGYSNKLPRTAGESIANDPGNTPFNPLFLYGPSGVGKTHLANAIGIRIKELYPEKRVLYISAHLFKVQYTDSVLHNTTNDFINFYQTIDTLIIDDIQEFANQTKTQNTFFHVFNHLHQLGKQLIMTSDRPPIMLEGMEDRLLTRFKWGLTAEMTRPNVELRKDILRNKIHYDGLKFPEEVINYIAENVNDSVRDLEGIVTSIMAYSTVYNREIDMDLAERVVKRAVKYESKPITIDNVITKVCKHFEVESSSLNTKSRKREVVMVRQIAMYLAKKYTDSSNSMIGQYIGHRDHATVIHACKTIKSQVEVNKGFKEEVETIEAELKKR
jgi:chromosomal replication initiator protein